MTVTMHSDPMQASRDAAKAGGLPVSKPGSQQDLSGPRQPEITGALSPDQDIHVTGTKTPPRSTRGGGATAAADSGSFAPAAGTGGASGFMGMNVGGASMMNPQKMAEAMGQGTQTAEKLARGILAIGSMAATSVSKTATAVGGAISNYSNSLVSNTPPLSQPLTVSGSYVNRLNLVQKFTQPAAYAADLTAQYMGELLFWLARAALAVYHQLAAMKMLPQITAGGKSDASGVPINPVRGGLPLASDELAAFKLVGAALLMAYVEVYDALEEAAQVLFRQAASAGERYLAHRHGGEAADVAAAALAIAADMMALTLNWFRCMGRAFFSKTATTTARGYLLDHMPDLHLD